MFFFLMVFLQQVAATAAQSGLATLPISILMFLLASRFGALG